MFECGFVINNKYKFLRIREFCDFFALFLKKHDVGGKD